MNVFSVFGAFGIITTTLVSLWASFKYLVFGHYRIDNDMGKRLLEKVRRDSSFVWELNREYAPAPRSPEMFDAFAVYGGVPLYFSRGERLLTAGWQSKDVVTMLYFPRWTRAKVDAFLGRSEVGMIPISAIMPGSRDKLGDLVPEDNPQLYLNSGTYEDIETEVSQVADGKKNRTGMLLHGSPGSGKTQFIKYLSKKYRLPINVVYLRPDFDNYDIARMFTEVPQRCIVLLEDFDNYFDGRECLMKNDQVKFTFDSFINALDGIHNDYKGVVFAMTANDVSKIDESLKNRPSRLKYVRDFGRPSAEVRRKILGDDALVAQSEGFTLDQVFKLAGECSGDSDLSA